jgi:hypothetical protein
MAAFPPLSFEAAGRSKKGQQDKVFNLLRS